MGSQQEKRPVWMSPMIYGGMAITFISIGACQFVENKSTELGLVGIAIVGIAMSMAPLWYRRTAGWWRSIQNAADATDDHWHLTDRDRSSDEEDPSSTECRSTDEDRDDRD